MAIKRETEREKMLKKDKATGSRPMAMMKKTKTTAVKKGRGGGF